MKKLNLKLAIYACSVLVIMVISAFSMVKPDVEVKEGPSLESLSRNTTSDSACPEYSETIQTYTCFYIAIVPHFPGGTCPSCGLDHPEYYEDEEERMGVWLECKPVDRPIICSVWGMCY